MRKPYQVWLSVLLVCFATVVASAQSFRVQCPTSTITHPTAANNNAEPAYTGATTFATSTTSTGQYQRPTNHINGAIKCQQISGGDGYSTMGDGTQTYMFSFGPLSGVAKIASGQPGTDFPNEFNQVYSGPTLQPGEPATTDDPNQDGNSNPADIHLGNFTYNGAIGLVGDLDANRTLGISSISEGAGVNAHTVPFRG
jgi:hypothetical protein